ncbi:MAG: hypothetical protein K0R18_1303 [Bacillales bacterium]|jgi:hypothetical protein|nr:hypothetical protein [Bacillales bacterium]
MDQVTRRIVWGTSMNQLKEKLIRIKSNDFKLTEVENESAFVIALEMLNQIGSTDPVLRDELIFETFWRWIEWDVFSPEQLKKFLGICLDDQHLYFGITKNEDDSVFTRSFTSLVLTCIFAKDNEKPFLSFADVHSARERFFEYFVQERDFRGIVDDKGWAHAIAHAADCLYILAESKHLRAKDLKVMLEIIRQKIAEPATVFIADEQERLSLVISTIANRKILEEGVLENWLFSLKEFDSSVSLSASINVKQFLRSIYFRVLGHETLMKKIQETLTILQKH